MALYKPIRQDDGVTTCYHRILYITSTVNKQNSIAVLSYVNSDDRDDEKNSTVFQPYRKAITYETGYDENMNAVKAYEYLKTLPEFSGAEDV